MNRSGSALAVKLGEPSVVVVHLLSVERDSRFHGPQAARHMGAVQVAVVVERVTAVQHPAVAGVDRDAGVTSGVAGQRDEHDAGSDVVELLRRREAAPGFSVRAVFDDVQLGQPTAAGRIGPSPRGWARRMPRTPQRR